MSWESARSPLISTHGVIKSRDISWSDPVCPEPSLLLWPAQGTSQLLLHGWAVVWAPSRSQALLSRFLLEKVLFKANTVARSWCWSKAVAVWGWLWCWALSGWGDELFVHGQLGCDPGAGTGLSLSLFKTKLLHSGSCFLLAAIEGFLSKWFLNPWSISDLCMDCYCVWETWILPRHSPYWKLTQKSWAAVVYLRPACSRILLLCFCCVQAVF